MDASEVKNLKDVLFARLDEHEAKWQLRLHIERLVSHIESEQRTQLQHSKDIDELKGAVMDSNDSVGLRTWRRETERMLNNFTKLFWGIAGGVGLLLAKAGWEIVLDILRQSPK